MIISTIRNSTQDERYDWTERLPSVYKRFENFMMKVIFVTLILLAPFLIYDHYQPVASNAQAVYLIVIVVLSIFLCLRWTKKYEGDIGNEKQIADLMQVEVVNVKTNRAIKREDQEDFGVAYYMDVTDNGQRRLRWSN